MEGLGVRLDSRSIPIRHLDKLCLEFRVCYSLGFGVWGLGWMHDASRETIREWFRRLKR